MEFPESPFKITHIPHSLPTYEGLEEVDIPGIPSCKATGSNYTGCHWVALKEVSGFRV